MKHGARAAEAAVADYLRRRGFDLVAANLRLGALELDVVARRDELVVVVEVRTRGPGALTRPLGSIGGRKRWHVRKAAERLWQRRYRNDPSVSHLRIDAASVTFTEGGPAVEYVEAAF